MESNKIDLKKFLENTKEVFSNYLDEYGFQESEASTEKYFCTLIYKNKKRYIKISGSIHPRDYPPYFNIILGEGKTDWPETDWNSIALWKIKEHLNPKSKAKPYSIPEIDKIHYTLSHAKNELNKYGNEFLKGETQLFKKIRGNVNKDREPYKIYKPRKSGGLKLLLDKISSNLKKRFS